MTPKRSRSKKSSVVRVGGGGRGGGRGGDRGGLLEGEGEGEETGWSDQLHSQMMY